MDGVRKRDGIVSSLVSVFVVQIFSLIEKSDRTGLLEKGSRSHWVVISPALSFRDPKQRQIELLEESSHMRRPNCHKHPGIPKKTDNLVTDMAAAVIH
jgi:hypothetical protein